jgi:hypothetical protein
MRHVGYLFVDLLIKQRRHLNLQEICKNQMERVFLLKYSVEINYTSVTTNLNVFPSRSRRKSGFSGISLLFRNHVNSTPSPASGNKRKRIVVK